MSIPHPESTKYNPVLLDTLTSPNTSSHYGKRPQGNVVNLLPFPECDSSDDDYSEKEEIVEKINDIRLQKTLLPEHPEASSSPKALPKDMEEEKLIERLESKEPLKKVRFWHHLAPSIELVAMCIICFIAFASRFFSLLKWETIIHEIDPWFNYKVAQYIDKHGIQAFSSFVDHEVWYPWSRNVATSTYPGMMFTALFIQRFASKFLMSPIHIQEACCLTPPIFAIFTCISVHLAAKELSGYAGAGLIAAFGVSVLPSYMARSTFGHFDNEATAIFGIFNTIYWFFKSLRTGSLVDCTITSFSFFYLVLCWGGYVFPLGLISVFGAFVAIVGRLDIKTYTAFSIFHIFGNLLANLLPVVAIANIWRATEHMVSHLAFIIVQFVMIQQTLKSRLSKKNYEFLSMLLLRFMALGIVLIIIYVSTSGATNHNYRIQSLLNPVKTKKENTFAASISEHKATLWTRYFSDMNYLVFLAPTAAWYALRKKVNNTKIMASLMVLLPFYFSSVMIRLLIVAGPGVCILGGFIVSKILRKSIASIKNFVLHLFGIKKRRSKRRYIPVEASVVAIGLLCLYLCRTIWIGNRYAGLRFNGIGGVAQDYYDKAGKRHINDELREVHYWLKRNTEKDAVVFAWWDYGYKLNGLADKTTVNDNHTSGPKEIAKVGLVLSSSEADAYELLKEWDVDYVMIMYNGVAVSGPDDLGKFLWYPRHAHEHYPWIKEANYKTKNGSWRLDSAVFTHMHQCLAYKLSYFKMDEYYLKDKGWSYDRRREIYLHVSLSLRSLSQSSLGTSRRSSQPPTGFTEYTK
jgi:dolichyl-diphosphooligosaccharide--protein glycosyltransferase